MSSATLEATEPSSLRSLASIACRISSRRASKYMCTASATRSFLVMPRKSVRDELIDGHVDLQRGRRARCLRLGLVYDGHGCLLAAGTKRNFYSSLLADAAMREMSEPAVRHAQVLDDGLVDAWSNWDDPPRNASTSSKEELVQGRSMRSSSHSRNARVSISAWTSLTTAAESR